MEKIVGFIPIKFHSSRLPNKNFLLLDKKPLCRYIFDVLNQVEGIDEKYVYCSDERIKEYMPEGLEFLRRDPCLDQDHVRRLDIIGSFVRDVDADIYILTHATQPFTRSSSIKKALEKVLSGEYDSAFSSVKFQDYFWKDGKPWNYDRKNVVRTQDLTPIYMETGAVFIFRKFVYTELGQSVGNHPYMYEIDPFEAIDIDTKEDFEYAEFVGKYLKGKQLL